MDAKNYHCPNCGQPGAHFAPPSMGEEGFFVCEENRDPAFLREKRFIPHSRGFSRKCRICNCAWSAKLHGDFCPEHGYHADMYADQIREQDMFELFSPLPDAVIKVNDNFVLFRREMPSGYYKANPNEPIKTDTVRLHRYAAYNPDTRETLDYCVGWYPRNNVIVLYDPTVAGPKTWKEWK